MRANRFRFRRASLVAGAGLIVVVSGQQVGCTGGSDSGGSSVESGGADGLGTVGMKLTLPGGEVLSSVSWVVTGPNGVSTVVQQGSSNELNSQSIAFTVAGIPAGSGYGVSVTGTSVDGTVTCAGSTTFAVTSRQTTNVTVLMQCGTAVPDAGSVAINGQTYNCAVASGVSASPSETTIGNSVNLSATGAGPNPGSLAFAWSAPSGTFSSPTGASTGFTCTAPGPVVVTATVTDGTLPTGASCNPALATSTVTVQCDSTLDAGTPDATVNPDASGATACSLGAGGAVKHVIYVQFDNTHLAQDVPNVQSDLEQMPHLLNFIRGNGTMMANDHTVLISHTGGGILSTLTGVYPDRHGQTVSNSYVRTSSAGAFSFPSTFQYWTDTVSATGTSTVPNLVQPDGTNMPAPWVTYTRAGCNFGAVGIADMELENVSTGATGDVTTVFGANSPQWNEAKANSAKAVTDFEGIAVHCAQGSSVCATGQTDVLAQEPGGYNGFQALFGAQQVDPLLTGQDAGVALIDLLGNPIQDSNGNPGFPGFNGMEPAVALGYMAAMQEHGVPVTYAYISDAHDSHGVDGSGQAAFGPGQQGYTQQLQAYDQAFANFFTRLASDGINQSNTLFVFTVDEGDHFVGVAPSPSTCDGTAGNFCSYPAPAGQSSGIGEVNVNIDTLFTSEQPAVASQFKMGNNANPTASYDFTVHGDDAPPFYLSRISATGGTTGPLTQTDPVVRNFERAAGQLTLVSPYTGNTDNLLYKMADQAGMQALHMMTTGDPARNATFAYFADADYFVTDFPTSTCADCIQSTFAWNHGDDQSVIGQTWLGFVGPGVKNQPDQTIWTDHTDVRPTINSVLGLHDDYISDGRVITQALQSTDYSSNLTSNLTTIETLGDNYKQINSPFDVFAQCILTASTYALQANDATYTSFESSITTLTSQRDTLATSIKSALDGAEFGSTPISSSQATTWINQAQGLVASCNSLVATIPTSTDAGTTTSSDSGSSTPSDAGGASSDAASTSNGDVVVYRVGDGAAGLTSSGSAVFVDEYNPTTGSLVKSTEMPTVASGSNHRLIASGTATSEGMMTTSVDGRYVVLTGYDSPIPFTTADGGTASVASTVSSQVARVVGRLDAAGEIDTTTALTDFASGNNPRGVASTDGINIWVAGAVDSVHYTTLGSTTSVDLSTTITNLRGAEIFGSQLFVDDSSGSAVRLGTVGIGLPTTSGQTITNLPGFLTSGSPYAFFFADLDGNPGLDTLYVADDGGSGSSGGVTKYGLVSGSWTAEGTIGSAADTYRGLTGVVNGTTVTLYAVRKGGTAAVGGGELDAIVDSTGFGGAFSGAPTLIATAATNTAFRGVALAPHP
jgi:hypothetical protein